MCVWGGPLAVPPVVFLVLSDALVRNHSRRPERLEKQTREEEEGWGDVKRQLVAGRVRVLLGKSNLYPASCLSSCGL